MYIVHWEAMKIPKGIKIVLNEKEHNLSLPKLKFMSGNPQDGRRLSTETTKSVIKHKFLQVPNGR